MDALRIENLTTAFNTEQGIIKAIDGISLNLRKGTILGIAGESGAGKSVLANTIMGLVKPSEGKVLLDGIDILSLSEDEMRAIRGKRIAMIGQDPSSALNPFLRISTEFFDVMTIHEKMKKTEALEKARKLLHSAGLPEPERILRMYPHQLSGGMKQRVMIAIALSMGADILIADEPTASLDATTERQILNLLVSLKEKRSILLITHSLDVLESIADETAVIYSGTIVEKGTTEQILKTPKHPYTKGLIDAIPRPGSLPIPIAGSCKREDSGCAFSGRCPLRMEICSQHKPKNRKLRDGREIACHLFQEERDG